MSKAFFQEAAHAASYALYRPAYTNEIADVVLGKLEQSLPSQVRCDSGFHLHVHTVDFKPLAHVSKRQSPIDR